MPVTSTLICVKTKCNYKSVTCIDEFCKFHEAHSPPVPEMPPLLLSSGFDQEAFSKEERLFRNSNIHILYHEMITIQVFCHEGLLYWFNLVG